MDFLELRQVLSTYDGYHREPLWWTQERPVPCELLGGLSGFLSRRCQGLRPCVESVPAGVQPRCIQGIRSGDGVGKERLIYLLI